MSADEVLCTRSSDRQIADVWQQAARLSEIAVEKYRWLRRAMFSSLVTMTSTLLWLALSAWAG
ncbi:hypothetical protein FB565_003353 [Actinoplanes lutulentus]|nr:hypothetical protein [Actinoplanes lutulentus]